MSSGALFEGHVQPGPQLQDVPQVQDVPQLQAEFPQTSLFVGLLEAAYEQLGPQLHAAPHAHAEPVQHKSETNASPAVGPFDRLEQLGPQDATSRLTSDSDVATSETLSRVAEFADHNGMQALDLARELAPCLAWYGDDTCKSS